jgi:indole-3-glycerol phosphate synthase
LNRLAEILDARRRDLEEMKALTSLEAMEQRAKRAGPVRGFRRALEEAPRPAALIAEVKRASPSKGVIREEFQPVAVARAYERGGATCLSVLTEERFFHGSRDDLTEVKRAVGLPVLRKDFILDVWQVFETRAIGADCMLLIVAALEDAQLTEYHLLATRLGMDVLVEVHNEAELERALALDADLIGINNRDLTTFETDLSVTERLAPLIPEGRVIVSESAIWTQEDVQRVAAAGARAVLVGEALMRSEDIEAATRRLLGR